MLKLKVVHHIFTHIHILQIKYKIETENFRKQTSRLIKLIKLIKKC